MMRHRRTLLITLLTLTSAGSAFAQDYLYEFGVAGGMSTAYGDINKSKVLYNPGLVGGLQMRYSHNLRWSFAAELGSYGLKGDSRDFDNHYPADAAISFDRRLWQLSLRPEFSFRNYGWGNDFREKHRFVPFVTAGIGFGIAVGDSQVSSSTSSEEDAATDAGPLFTTSDGSSFVFSIPVGAGFKWKMSPRWNLQATCLFTKTFSDETDGISDPMGIKSGAMKNTDWIGSLTVGISYSFGLRCVTCNSDKE